MSNQYSKGLISLCLIGLLSGCSTPTTHFYTLESQSKAPAITSASNTHKVLIGMGPLSLPALLDRKQLITHTENNRIELAEFEQWAAPLKDNVLAVLRKNLATLQTNAIVRAFPWSIYGDVDYRVIIDISRFDIQLGKSVYLEASWAIMEEKKHTIINNGQTKIEQILTDTSYQNAAQLLSQLLDQLSQQIALSLAQVQQ
jgi:uncharacterized lipoprotein YmbA